MIGATLLARCAGSHTDRNAIAVSSYRQQTEIVQDVSALTMGVMNYTGGTFPELAGDAAGPDPRGDTFMKTPGPLFSL